MKDAEWEAIRAQAASLRESGLRLEVHMDPSAFRPRLTEWEVFLNADDADDLVIRMERTRL